MLTPKKIKRIESDFLEIAWNNGESSLVSIASLRNACPCATCREAVGAKPSEMPPVLAKAMGVYEITEIKPVGNYALQFVFKDGHKEGIYSWEILKEICDASPVASTNNEDPN